MSFHEPSGVAFENISLETAPIAALILDLDTTILAANAAAARVAGCEPGRLVGARLADLVPAFADRWPALLAASRAHGDASDELSFDAPAGPRSLQLVISPLAAGADGRERVQAFALDITARKAEELAARARAEADEQLAARQRLESLGLVAGGIAHDFNNLLVGVLAEASAVREHRALDADTREALRRIEGAARRMAQLTRQLLAFAGRGQLATVPVDAEELLDDMREQLARAIRPELALALQPGAGVSIVEADPNLLRQIIANLVSNASDAATSHIAVTTARVARGAAPFWQLEVADDGPGIDATTLTRIFEPFFTTRPGQHGLGLSAVHGIVRRLGGEIEVDTRVGQGTRFRVQLPIIVGAEPAPRRASEVVPVAPRLAGIRILVADDEPSVRATVRRLLERRGATVVLADDGLDAEAKLREQPFDLVISDVMMPGCSGYDVLAIARATQPGIRVVLMSGYTEKLRGEAGEDEPDAFLEKPFTAKLLDTTIDEVL